MMPLPAKGEICAVMLFGSRARGDHTPESDIDILLCLREGTPSLSGEGNLSISIYPKAQLLEMAERLLGSPLGDVRCAQDQVARLVELRDPQLRHLLDERGEAGRKLGLGNPDAGHEVFFIMPNLAVVPVMKLICPYRDPMT